MKNLKLILLFNLAFQLTTQGQTKSEFFVEVNPANGSFQNISTIPEIRWIPEGGLSWKYSTFDSKNRRFIFKGLDSLYNGYLVTLDAIDGSVLYNPFFPNTGDSLDDIFYLQYDTTTAKLYGIHKDVSSSTLFNFVSIDQTTGNITTVCNLNGITAIACGDQYSAFDSQNGRYFFYGVNSGSRLFTIDVASGTIIYNPLVGGNYREFQFDEITNKLYGILLTGISPNMSHTLVSIDIVTGSYSSIATIPGVFDVTASGQRFSTFDSNHGRYIFRGGDGLGNWNLYSIDVSDGSIVHNPSYPLPPINSTVDNVVELQYDNSSNQLFALHWGDVEFASTIEAESTPFLNIFPNPTNGITEIWMEDLPHDAKAQISIFDLSGSIVQSEIIVSKRSAIDLSNLATGTYLLTATYNGYSMTILVVKTA